MQKISENFKPVAEKNNFKVAYKSNTLNLNTLKSVTLGKNKLDMMEHCSVK